MSELAPLLGAIAVLLAPVGGGVAFVWNKVSTLSAKVEECEKHRGSDRVIMNRVIFHAWRDAGATRALIVELHRIDPDNPTLGMVLAGLNAAPDFETFKPADFADLLAKLDQIPLPKGPAL